MKTMRMRLGMIAMRRQQQQQQQQQRALVVVVAGCIAVARGESFRTTPHAQSPVCLPVQPALPSLMSVELRGCLALCVVAS
eukprot:COSAG02_NODE_32377_length_517_cov_0.868421_1_plen_81_part_00